MKKKTTNDNPEALQKALEMDLDDLSIVSGGWGIADWAPSDQADWFGMRDEWERLCKLAESDPSYKALADKKMEEMESQFAFLKKKYDFLESRGAL